MKSIIPGVHAEILDSSHSMKNITLNEFPEYINNKYRGRVINGHLSIEINEDIKTYCNILYNQGKVNKELRDEMIEFFKCRFEYE
jgi:hypothetical protein